MEMSQGSEGKETKGKKSCLLLHTNVRARTHTHMQDVCVAQAHQGASALSSPSLPLLHSTNLLCADDVPLWLPDHVLEAISIVMVRNWVATRGKQCPIQFFIAAI